MTYPNENPGLTSVGVFTSDKKEHHELRARLAAIALQWYDTCQNQRINQERQWYLNMAFYGGNQYVQFRKTSDNGPYDLYTPPAPYYRPRIVINQTRKIIRKEVARLTAQKPNAYIVPSSSEDADVFAAQAGEQIWDSLWRRLKFNRVLRQAVFWQAVCGTGFIKTYWDTNKVDPNNPGIYGDICIENISPFYIFVPDLLAEELEDQPYLIHAQVRDKSWIRRVFGVEPEDTRVAMTDEKLQQVLGIQRQNNKKDQSIILEVWVKPGYLPELPNGGMFTVVGGQVVQGFDKWPYEFSEYPFSKLDATLTGKFYKDSIIVDLIPLQRELNRTRSQLIEAKNRTAKPQLIAQRGSVNPKMITTEPGQVIEVAVGFEMPQPLPIQNLPTYVTEEINRLYDDLADLSGQHEVSNGSTPPGVTAATAISFLQEQDEGLVAPNFSSIEEAIEKIAGQCLMYVQMFWDEDRIVKVVGIDGTFDAQTFKSSSLRGNADIRVESGSALPTSRAAKQAFLLDLMKMGFIPPNDGLEMMELGGLNKIYERLQVDRRQAQRENMKMRVVTEQDIMMHNEAWMQENPEMQKDIDSGLQLEPPLIVQVHTYDNHQVHIDMHNQYRKSQNFEMADKHVQALFEEHVRQHQEAMMGIVQHPLTGMADSNPNAAPPGEEEAQEQQMMEENPEEAATQSGPEVMPDLSDEQPEGGIM